MQISELRLRNFMSHIDSEVRFPEHGIVLVTGKNGGGKSSLIEAVSVALWGKTLRGTNPWRSEEVGEVIAKNGSIIAARRRTGAKTELSWSDGAVAATDYPTTTKAQEALEAQIGGWDTWRRTSVFSSQDAAHFTMASDGERKRLLETILGLDKFDMALDRCRVDLKVSERAGIDAENRLRILEERIASSAQHLRDAKESLKVIDETADPVVFEKEFAEIEKMLGPCRMEIHDLEHERSLLKEEFFAVQSEAELAAKEWARINHDKCPVCSQTIPSSLRQRLERVAGAARTKAAKIQEGIKTKKSKLEVALTELQEEQMALSRKSVDLRGELRACQKFLEHKTLVEATVGKAKAEHARAKEEKAAADAAAVETFVDVGELQACEKVLGLKGVRAHVLGKALVGVEAVANRWLKQIAGDSLSIHLAPYTEKKTGGVSDAISLDVIGAGGGFGYRAASGGERRRIDVALLMALAEVSRAAHGASSGIIFMDEVADSLDTEGTQRVAEALRELSKSCCAVIISHNADLAAALDPDMHLVVDSGSVTPA